MKVMRFWYSLSDGYMLITITYLNYVKYMTIVIRERLDFNLYVGA